MNEIIKSGTARYTRRIGTDHPGLILILIDQSSSMGDSSKAINAALAVNRVIYSIILASQAGTEVKNRAYIGVLGYGRGINPVVAGWVAEIAAKPKGIERLAQKVSDGAGGLVEVEIERPYWVEVVADNGTPMAEALEKAYEVARQWASQHQDCFPPVAINITDGEPNDFTEGTAVRTEAAAQKLTEVRTADGNLLLFNVHITGRSGTAIVLPSSESELSDSYARLLFRMSSVLPDKMIEEARVVGYQPRVNARGFIFNADTDNLIKLLTFGSSTFSR